MAAVAVATTTHRTDCTSLRRYANAQTAAAVGTRRSQTTLRQVSHPTRTWDDRVKNRHSDYTLLGEVLPQRSVPAKNARVNGSIKKQPAHSHLPSARTKTQLC